MQQVALTPGGRWWFVVDVVVGQIRRILRVLNLQSHLPSGSVPRSVVCPARYMNLAMSVLSSIEMHLGGIV